LDLQNNDQKIAEESYDIYDIIKFFYNDNKWVSVSNTDNIENKINNTFNKLNYFYEILNKDFYYNYGLKEDKIIFLSKGIKNNINQYYNENIKNIILDNNKYVVIEKDIKKEDCKYKLKCINPICKFSHPENYNLNLAYKQYIVEERNKNPMFKSLDCNFKDDMCQKHKYNKCKYKHKNDPIEEK
jgi:hypothetical protein